MVIDSAPIQSIVRLNGCLDELTTRLTLHGSSALSASDLQQFAMIAATHSVHRLAEGANKLSLVLSGSGEMPDAEALSAALAQLRAVLDEAYHPDSSLLDPSSRSPSKVISDDEEMVREFITEAEEHLSRIEGQLLLLEKDNKDVETLNAVFRAFHTVKGLAGFLEFPSIQNLAHEVESLLDLARTLHLEVTSEVIDLVLESADLLRQELTNIERIMNRQKAAPAGNHDLFLQRIRSVIAGEPTRLALRSPLPELPLVLPEDVIGASITPREVEAARSETSRTADSASLRIETGKLDQLMDLVGELVIAHTLIGHNPALGALKDARLLRDLSQMARITAGLQRITTGMRMVSIGQQFQKTARVVRDLSRKAGKEIVLETSGEDTELDKTIAEELSDPMLHMVRNSIDHGIESVEERVAKGKDPVAHIRIAAYHSSGQIVVEIADDGRGLDRQKILTKAVKRDWFAQARN